MIISTYDDEIEEIPVTNEVFLRFVRVDEDVYVAHNSKMSHKYLVSYFDLDIDEIEDAGFVRHWEDGQVEVEGFSQTLRIGDENSFEREETKKLVGAT